MSTSKLEDEPVLILAEDAKQFFEQVTGLHGQELVDHISKIQREALVVFSYPCIRRGGFASLRMKRHSQYQLFLDKSRQGKQNVLDIGSCGLLVH
jgi:hypothetical protein